MTDGAASAYTGLGLLYSRAPPLRPIRSLPAPIPATNNTRVAPRVLRAAPHCNSRGPRDPSPLAVLQSVHPGKARAADLLSSRPPRLPVPRRPCGNEPRARGDRHGRGEVCFSGRKSRRLLATPFAPSLPQPPPPTIIATPLHSLCFPPPSPGARPGGLQQGTPITKIVTVRRRKTARPPPTPWFRPRLTPCRWNEFKAKRNDGN